MTDLNSWQAEDRVELPEDATPGQRIVVSFDAGGRLDAVVLRRPDDELGSNLDFDSLRYSRPAEAQWSWGVAAGLGPHLLSTRHPLTGSRWTPQPPRSCTPGPWNTVPPPSRRVRSGRSRATSSPEPAAGSGGRRIALAAVAAWAVAAVAAVSVIAAQGRGQSSEGARPPAGGKPASTGRPGACPAPW